MQGEDGAVRHHGAPIEEFFKYNRWRFIRSNWNLVAMVYEETGDASGRGQGTKRHVTCKAPEGELRGYPLGALQITCLSVL